MTRRFRRCRSGDVLTPTFAAVAILFCSLMFVAYVIDRAVNATDWAKRLDNSIFRSEILHEYHHSSGCRYPVSGAMGHGRHYPHARTQDDQHLGSHGATRDRGLDAVPFHIEVRRGRDHGAVRVCRGGIWRLPHDGLPDLPGVAVYLALTGVKNPHLSALRLPVLYTGVAVTMMWGAIEKFGYPSWTFPLLATHPGLTLGFSFEQFMYIAGFVEFSLAFFMVTGTTLLRFSCAALLILMVSAVPEFGKVDAVGHLLIVAGLLAMIIAGQRTIQLPLALVRSGIVAQAGTLTMAYSATIAMFFGLYYSSQFLAGR